MSLRRTPKATVKAYRRSLEQLEAEARRWVEIVFEQQAKLAAFLPPETELDAQLEDGPAELITDLWRTTDDLTLLLADLIAFCRRNRASRRHARRSASTTAYEVWQQLRPTPTPPSQEHPPASTRDSSGFPPPMKIAFPRRVQESFSIHTNF